MSGEASRIAARTDEELAVAALDDDGAFEELYHRYVPIARRMARRAAGRMPRMDVGDTTSLAMTKLWTALPGFDPTRPFEPWATVVMSRAVKTAAAAALTAKNSFNWWAMLYREDADGIDGDTPLDRVADLRSPNDAALLLSEEEAILSAFLDEVLSDREAKVMRLRLSGWSYPRSLHLHWELFIDDAFLGQGAGVGETATIYAHLFGTG